MKRDERCSLGHALVARDFGWWEQNHGKTVPLKSSSLSEQTDGPTSATGDLQGGVQPGRGLGWN